MVVTHTHTHTLQLFLICSLCSFSFHSVGWLLLIRGTKKKKLLLFSSSVYFSILLAYSILCLRFLSLLFSWCVVFCAFVFSPLIWQLMFPFYFHVPPCTISFFVLSLPPPLLLSTSPSLSFSLTLPIFLIHLFFHFTDVLSAFFPCCCIAWS